MAFDEAIQEDGVASQVTEREVQDPIFVNAVPGVEEPLDSEAGPDNTKFIQFQQDVYVQLPPFQMALALFAHSTGMSRTEYATWREMLQLLRDENGRSIPEVSKLPNQLSTLKNSLTKRLPLLDMRSTDIPLRVEKLPTSTATMKKKQKATAQPTADSPEADSILSTMHFFDPKSLFKAFLSSDTAKRNALTIW